MKRAVFRHLFLAWLLFSAALSSYAANAQDAKAAKDPAWLLPIPEVDADDKIPTLEKVVGHRWGQDISNHAEIERYIQALAKAAPDRCQMIPYGKSSQGRSLNLLVITSPANLKQLEEIRKDNLALADSRITSEEKAKELAEKAPAVVWLAYCVHGNETSPSDAALITAYHLLADKRAETKALLDKLVIVIDPLQNPDGRDRFVNFHRNARGGFDQDNPLASDRLEPWPGGRFNHYLFDMNRDWTMQTQQETKARVAAFLRWKPQIFVDAHEMGANNTFFFDPSAEPYDPKTLGRQKEWHKTIGRMHADQFDKYGFAYANREMYDGFGPQYGSTWPIFHGSIGILWEQSGVRGRVVSREDQTKLHYHDGVRHHYVSGLATLEAAAKHRRQLLIDFHANVADSVKLGETGPIRSFFLLEGKRPSRAANLAQVLVRNGIEVRRLTAEVKTKAADTIGGEATEQAVPAGSYCVSLNQPLSRLVLSLLERHQDMGADFIKRQEDRIQRGKPDEIYDSTAWSLPLAFGVRCLTVSTALEIKSDPYEGSMTEGKILGDGKKPRIGYMLSGDDDNSQLALSRWLQDGLRVRVLSEPSKVNGVTFPAGSLLLRSSENPEKLHEFVASAAKANGVNIHPVDSAFVEEGASLGGPHVHWVKPPQVLLVTERPTSHSVGHIWYLFDQVWHYPVTRISGSALAQVDWRQFDVCILPDGNYSRPEGPREDTIRRMKDWMQDGGTLILNGDASVWAASDKVKFLSSKLELRKVDDEKKPEKKEEGKEEKKDDKKDDKEPAEKVPPPPVPGVFVRANVDGDHFATWGMDKETVLSFSGNRLFTPLKKTAGKNLVTLADRKDLMVSGYCWQQTLPMLPGKPYLMYQSQGRGHILAFADDPTYRAASPNLQRMFFNAVFFGPAR